MKIAKPPKVGWGILNPDPELSQETLNLIEKIRALPRGQKEALLTRAVHRYLFVQEKLGVGEGDDQEPSASQMVRCTSTIGYFWGDILGLP